MYGSITCHCGHCQLLEDRIEEQYAKTHDVTVQPGGVLAGLGLEGVIKVNSVHAQGIARVAEGLRVEAVAEEPFVTENELTENMSAGGAAALEGIGSLAGMSCPECGGALWELSETPPRYRCHTGHAYTSTALFHAQNETVEEALWVAIRALHEKQLLLGRLMQSSKDHGRTATLREYELTSKGLESHKDTLRALLKNLRGVE